ncbi:MAG: NADPH-dependent oxidoreductase [Spirosoma sp.]|nr:NADPH-dependent oxidoreductase [Spirosoma sp.]
MNRPTCMNIALLSTSSRINSNSLRFVNYLKHILAESGQHDVSIVTFEDYDIPFVGQGSVKKDNLTPFQQELTSVWEAADLVIFALPEYNWTVPPQAANTIHQLGGPAFKHLFENKVFAMAGVSNGRGGRQPALDMTTVTNKIISFTNSYSIVSPKLYESHETDKNLDENGQFIGHEVYQRTVRNFVDYTLNVAQRWMQPSLVEVK